jgi:hypothetical protein
MSEATFEQANRQVKLYDLRREPRLREAREWFSDHFHPQSLDSELHAHSRSAFHSKAFAPIPKSVPSHFH